MALFMMHVDLTRRALGQNAVNSAAYILRDCIKCEFNGKTYDYRSRNDEQYVLASGTVLSSTAPKEWKDNPYALWNAAEAQIGKGAKNAQTQRRIILCLPNELTDEQNIELAKSIVSGYQIDGMCATWAVHKRKTKNEAGNYNVHLHILVPTARCNEDGFCNKYETVYVCRSMFNATEEKLLSADELKKPVFTKFEKVFNYVDTSTGETMFMSEHEASQYEHDNETTVKRVNRYPKKVKTAGRNWDGKEYIIQWRLDAEETINGYLALYQHPETVSCESYEKQGINRLPGQHMGGRVCRLEKEEKERCKAAGIKYLPITDVGKYNFYVKHFNKNIEEQEKQSQKRDKERMNKAQATQKEKQQQQQMQEQRQYQQKEQREKVGYSGGYISDAWVVLHELGEAEKEQEDARDKYGREII